METLRSLLNVVHKELIQALRDRRMVFTLLAAPVLQLVMFGYAIDLTVDHIPSAVCDQDRTEQSRALLGDLFADGTFAGRLDVPDPDAAERALEDGEAAVAFIVPRGYGARLARADAPEVQVLVDGSDAARAQVAASSAGLILGRRGVGVGAPARPGHAITPRILYNQRLESPVYMLPGILASLLLNVTAIITAMGLAREREAGTIEQLLVTPIRPVVLLAGKCVPFIFFGLLDVLAVLLLGSLIFGLPIRGSFGLLALGAFLYLFSTLGIGILIAAVSPSQQQAMMGAFAFMLPAMLLSGFMSPIDTMPWWLRPVTALLPMRHFIEIMRGCLLKGATARDLWPQLGALAALGAVILSAAVARFHRRLS